jgi:hypothetical protein
VKTRLLAVLALAVLGVFASAFAAANTVPATKAGDGAGVISGYTVTNVKYTLNGTNPRNIDDVKFDLEGAPPAGSSMKIKLVSGGSTYYSCTNSGVALTCVTTSPQANVATADELRVVVVP